MIRIFLHGCSMVENGNTRTRILYKHRIKCISSLTSKDFFLEMGFLQSLKDFFKGFHLQGFF